MAKSEPPDRGYDSPDRLDPKFRKKTANTLPSFGKIKRQVATNGMQEALKRRLQKRG